MHKQKVELNIRRSTLATITQRITGLQRNQESPVDQTRPGAEADRDGGAAAVDRFCWFIRCRAQHFYWITGGCKSCNKERGLSQTRVKMVEFKKLNGIWQQIQLSD